MLHDQVLPARIGEQRVSHGRIRALSDAEAQKVKSSAVITSLAQVVLGLLENALDAESRKIEIQIEHSRGSCSVEDDGHGIPPVEFAANGGLGRMHHTSKYGDTAAPYGRHGDFLASLSALSLLTILSKHQAYRSTNRITVHRTEIISRLTPVPTSENSKFHEQGTMVSVKNLFGDMPVRVKHRSLVEQTSSRTERLWNSIKLQIMAYLLAWPKPVTVKMIDLDSGRTMNILALESWHTGLSTSASLKQSSDLSLAKFSGILGQSSYANLVSGQSWIPASASSTSFMIKGVIGLMPAPTKSFQFISIGCHPLFSQEGTNEFFDIINRAFQKSDFGAIDNIATRYQIGALSARDRTITQKALLPGRKGVDRWPMFNLTVSFKMSQKWPQSLQGCAKTETSAKILAALEALITRWLSAHHFRVPLRHGSKHFTDPVCTIKESEAISPRQRVNPMLTRATSSKDMRTTNGGPEMLGSQCLEQNDASKSKLSTRMNGDSVKPKLDGSRKSTIKSSGTAINSSQHHTVLSSRTGQVLASSATSDIIKETNASADHSDMNQVMTWIDPIAQTTYAVNARTGMPVRERLSKIKHQTSGRLTIKTSNSHTKTSTAGWITDLRSEWINPVFQAATEDSLPQLDHERGHERSHCRHHTHGKHVTPDVSILPIKHKFSKDSLRRARVIQQVDHQFILAALPITSDHYDESEVLVAIDQHAADERIRVEKLYAELCEDVVRTTLSEQASSVPVHNARNVILYPPKLFQISAAEISLFARHSDKFLRWGISYEVDVARSSEQNSNGQLLVRTLPTAVAERCKAEPDLLITMLRKHLWSLVEKSDLEVGPDIIINAPDADGPSWMRAIGGCPTDMIEMLNSRACRSAIMFNDNLTLNQCEVLVQQLSLCSFPFQCAHGRPSMVPLLRVNRDQTTDNMRAGQQLERSDMPSFAHAAREWSLGFS